MKANVLIGLLLIFGAIQFVRPAKNLGPGPGGGANDITALHPAPPAVKAVLERACYDCHSDHTRYPWYAEVQPVAWWLARHVTEGRRHLNFSQFGAYDAKRAARKMKQTAEEVRKGDMPLASYTFIHRDARLSADERSALEAWARSVQQAVSAAPAPAPSS